MRRRNEKINISHTEKGKGNVLGLTSQGLNWLLIDPLSLETVSSKSEGSLSHVGVFG